MVRAGGVGTKILMRVGGFESPAMMSRRLGASSVAPSRQYSLPPWVGEGVVALGTGFSRWFDRSEFPDAVTSSESVMGLSRLAMEQGLAHMRVCVPVSGWPHDFALAQKMSSVVES